MKEAHNDEYWNKSLVEIQYTWQRTHLGYISSLRTSE